MSDGLAIRTADQPSGQPSLQEFLTENGRLPVIGDAVKPWDYRGWLLPYVQLAEDHPAVSPRYEYVARTLEAGKLLDEPIPRIEFLGEHDAAARPGLKHVDDMMKIIGYRSNSWNAFRDLCDWLGFGLGVTAERSRLDEDLQDQLYRKFSLEHWLTAPTDYLGQYLCEMNHNKAGGFFPTPMTICTMMVQMTFGSSEGVDHRAKTTMDPAVGTGRFLLAASNYSMRLFGQDIDGLVCLVSKINLTLFAPWHYIPETFWKPYDDQKRLCESPESEKTAPASPNKPDLGNFQTSEPAFSTVMVEQMSLFDL